MKTWKAALVAALLFGAPWPAGFRTTAHAALEQTSDPNTLTGIGAVLVLQDGGPMVREIVPGGPAGRDGRLQVGDRINGVAQGDGAFVNCGALTLDKVVAMIRGGKGTTVRLQVISGGQLKIINLVRAQIKLSQPANAGLAANDETPAESAAEAAKLAALLGKISDETRKLQSGYMATKVDAVAKATGLDAGGRKALETAAAQAVDQGVQKSDAALAELCRAQFSGARPRQLTAALNLGNDPNATIGTPASYARAWQRQGGISPSDMPAWAAALKQTLTPAQATAWDAAEAKRKLEVESEIGDYLNGVDVMGTELEARVLTPSATEVRQALNLSSDRLDKLEALEKSVASDFGDAARAAAEKALLAMADDERKEVVAQKSYYNWLPPLTKNRWDEALPKLFSPEEVRQIQTAKEDRKDDRARAMGKVLLALMDERTALTAAQRQLLEPIAERLVKNEDDLVSPNPNENYSISPSTIYGAAGNGSGDEIKAILDPLQWRHWRDAAELKNIPEDGAYQESVVQLPPADATSVPAAPAPAPEDVERMISDFLADKSKTAREQMFAGQMLKAEDVARVLHLPEEAAARLDTAARGSADAALNGWNASMEQMVRSNISDATPETVKERLAAIQSYQFEQRGMQIGSAATPDGSVWDRAVKEELSPDQQKEWKVETDARGVYRAKAVAGWITCSFAQSFGLSPDQSAKLEPMIGNVLIKYTPGIGSFFSNNAWYLESFYMYLPVAGIPGKDLEALLSKDQLDHWNGSQMHAIASSYWTNIARMNPQLGGN